ncbi:hypothetical protein LUZ60_011511 [Juncus effusus]|nr:hypothetical protein LUZ60_011511 [Juncus effusus]
MEDIPPGFTSLTSFLLQRVQNQDCCADDSINEQIDDPMEKFRSSLRRKPWVNYRKFDEEGEDSRPDQRPSSICLPKGIVRGCSECPNCQKVVARWRPGESRKPVLDEAPVFYPTEEEFKDSLNYIESIRIHAEKYGICRIIPPSSWKPPKAQNKWGNSQFVTRVQQIDKLQNREAAPKRTRQTADVTDDVIIEPNQAVERFGFLRGPTFNLEMFQKYADSFKEQYFQSDEKKGNILNISVDDVEGEYWRIVEKPTESIEVLYGADLDTASFGSGFPKRPSPNNPNNDKYIHSNLKNPKDDKYIHSNLNNPNDDKCIHSNLNNPKDDKYIHSDWNLNNVRRLNGSVLRFESGTIPGVQVPWLYIGMCFSSFCWHVEDHHLYSLNYHHFGDPKVWYGVPGFEAFKLERAMKKHLPHLFEEQPDLLHNLVTQLSPSLLKQEGISVYKCIQHEGEFVLTFPRAYHSGFNTGFNCAEAVNVAPCDWLPHGQTAVELYREQKRNITLSHDKLLLGAANDAVRAQWEIFFLKINTLNNLRWKRLSGFDGILTKTLYARNKVEQMRRKYLCVPSRCKKMDKEFDAIERECVVCHFDLYLAAACCETCESKFACLIHAKELCECEWSRKYFMFRYDEAELSLLFDALGGKPSAIHKWGVSYLGLNLRSKR